ncbi:MAG: PEP-CTERM sorting domain-containing protein [Porticoccus sp.]|nr:PEP-CTERM sorting domain-containing protein [Porticoccus sp.]
MKRFIASSLLTLTSLFLFCGQLNAAVVYNNGSSTTHTGGYCSDCSGGGWTVYDDFTLSANTVIGGIEWDAAYYAGTDTSNDITISFSSAVGSGLIASSTFTWSDVVTNNNSNVNSTFYADLVDLAFNAGTYYLSIYSYNHFMPNSSGNGVWQTRGDATFVRDSAYIPFRLFGENDVVGHVPVPTTLVLMSLGLFSFGVCQRRKKA